MKIDIVSKNENKLMDRVEVNFKADHDGEATPSRDTVRTALAGAMGVPKERVIVSDMDSKYGVGLTDGYAKVYNEVESAKKFEKNYLLVRNGMADKKPKRVKASVVKKTKR